MIKREQLSYLQFNLKTTMKCKEKGYRRETSRIERNTKLCKPHLQMTFKTNTVKPCVHFNKK